MMRVRWVLRFTLATFVLGMTLQAVAQESLTVRTKVYPVMESGKLTGCQLSFSVLRTDYEFNDRKPTLVNGLLAFFVSGGVSLRLGTASDASFENFVPAERAYLYSEFRSNSEDFISQALSSEEGFALFFFKLGDQTTSAILRLMDKGEAEILYAPKAATIDARFKIDLAAQADTHMEFMQCMDAATGD